MLERHLLMQLLNKSIQKYTFWARTRRGTYGSIYTRLTRPDPTRPDYRPDPTIPGDNPTWAALQPGHRQLLSIGNHLFKEEIRNQYCSFFVTVMTIYCLWDPTQWNMNSLAKSQASLHTGNLSNIDYKWNNKHVSHWFVNILIHSPRRRLRYAWRTPRRVALMHAGRLIMQRYLY